MISLQDLVFYVSKRGFVLLLTLAFLVTFFTLPVTNSSQGYIYSSVVHKGLLLQGQREIIGKVKING